MSENGRGDLRPGIRELFVAIAGRPLPGWVSKLFMPVAGSVLIRTYSGAVMYLLPERLAGAPRQAALAEYDRVARELGLAEWFARRDQEPKQPPTDELAARRARGAP